VLQLLRDGFNEMVGEVWHNTLAQGSPIEIWQAKIRRLRQHLRGWAKHMSGAYKKEKTTLLDKLDELDKKTEIVLLSDFELDLKHVLSERLAELLREEELKWYQRAKVKHLLEGDANTKYYHLLANGRHRKTRIFQLEDGNNIISGDAQLKGHITNYFKNMFGPSEDSLIMLDESQTDDIPQVFDLENEYLTDAFSQEEVRAAIFQIEHNKAPGPDGFPLEFYQVFWNVIKDDLMVLFTDSTRESYHLAA
jgi:mannosylglycoprotein endo-beta-mannosidase